MHEDFPDRTRLRDERDQSDVAAARWALERPPPILAMRFAQAIRGVSCEIRICEYKVCTMVPE